MEGRRIRYMIEDLLEEAMKADGQFTISLMFPVSQEKKESEIDQAQSDEKTMVSISIAYPA